MSPIWQIPHGPCVGGQGGPGNSRSRPAKQGGSTQLLTHYTAYPSHFGLSGAKAPGRFLLLMLRAAMWREKRGDRSHDGNTYGARDYGVVDLQTMETQGQFTGPLAKLCLRCDEAWRWAGGGAGDD